MSTFAAGESHIKSLGIDDGGTVSASRVRDIVMLGFDYAPHQARQELRSTWGELADCFAVQVALDEEMKTTEPYVDYPEVISLYKKGTELVNTSAEQMAKHLATKNPLFWDEMVSHNKELIALFA